MFKKSWLLPTPMWYASITHLKQSYTIPHIIHVKSQKVKIKNHENNFQPFFSDPYPSKSSFTLSMPWNGFSPQRKTTTLNFHSFLFGFVFAFLRNFRVTDLFVLNYLLCIAFEDNSKVVPWGTHSLVELVKYKLQFT